MPKIYPQTDPIAKTLEVIGERWTILILQDLLRGHHRFAELRESVQGIAPNLLSSRLKLLERHGIVERRFYSDHPPRAEYYLTRKGHELGVVAGALATWGAKHVSDSAFLIHTECESRLQVVYYCPTCQAQVRGAQVRLAEREELSEATVSQPG